jgi:hypothetical protein
MVPSLVLMVAMAVRTAAADASDVYAKYEIKTRMMEYIRAGYLDPRATIPDPVTSSANRSVGPRRGVDYYTPVTPVKQQPPIPLLFSADIVISIGLVHHYGHGHPAHWVAEGPLWPTPASP